MPLQPHMKMLSTDDHLIEHPRVWQDRLPEKYKEMGPRVVEEPSSSGKPKQVWHYANQRYPSLGLNAVAGKAPEDWGVDPVRFDEMIPGCYDPKARLVDMDLDGVWAQLCFPSLPGFSGTMFLRRGDDGLREACIQAYNDFVLDEWCATDPSRYIPAVILPLWDIEKSVAEVQRTVAKGAKAICFTENPVPRGLPSFHTNHWDRLFAAVQEADTPLVVHFGSSGSAPNTAPEMPMATMITLFGTNSMSATADLLFSPTLHKFPKLKFGLSEGGIGWIPYILERADATWKKHRFYQNINQDVLPSDLFRRHFHGCFIEDDFGLENRDAIGVDLITWESDYPHSDSNWPNSRKLAEEQFKNVPDEDTHKIVELNVRRLYNFY
ncbi:putative TIM-barrel fold metal-dependent hydrolase [Amycolatopsis bartoniae]|uniref:Amidohydrolase n=1 Tax=Amycolatopsis bartoniae TaxID=941986 RepID=A0A8H9MBH9_9PSEU|nr:amidohydrolase family protein [Amycolatopsis bartoniae]MBB2939932.1 putative TIM-barrel fold metal-dependent hydrolase [Amycolatopsis bartoniae]TVT08284.1 amidohydrolase [Amycolatopsis bartoniae]GHF35621.1 amidohydrolase [Amycolatopsis bartoniae]